MLLLAGLIVARAGLFPSTGNPTPSARAFSEDFHNNERNWTIGSQDNGNFTAALAASQYMLTVGNARNTYFPHPDPASNDKECLYFNQGAKGTSAVAPNGATEDFFSIAQLIESGH